MIKLDRTEFQAKSYGFLLLVHNFFQMIGWTVAFFTTYRSLLLYYGERENMLIATKYVTFFQSLQIMEIVFAITGISKQNILNTFLQVSGRLYVIYYMLVYIYTWEFFLVSLAWSLSDIVRHFYYLSKQCNFMTQNIKYTRFTVSLILYPIGYIGELLCGINRIQKLKGSKIAQDIHMKEMCICYLGFSLPGFIYLYYYIYQQRNKILNEKNMKLKTD